MTPAAGEGPPRPACSIVVGAVGDEHDAGACLASLQPQVGPDVEVILVTHGVAGAGAAGAAGAAAPAWVRHVPAPAGLMAELWALGLAHATGEVVALTSAGMVPDGNWVARARLVAQRPEAAVGGAIEPGAGMGLVDWAIYFCRYAPYMLPLTDPSHLEVPADNAVYRAAVLDGYRPLWDQAFWETSVHQAMGADGHSFTLDGDLIVRQAGGATLRRFARQRFQHGQSYGRLRSRGMTSGSILRAALGAPLVPAVMAARAGRHVLVKKRHRAQFLLALPLLVVFFTCWAAGELVGRLRALAARARFERPAPVTARR